MLKLWHNKCREAKPAFTKNTGASSFGQKCCEQAVKLSSVQRTFILGCTWSWVCRIQGALYASIRTEPVMFSLLPKCPCGLQGEADPSLTPLLLFASRQFKPCRFISGSRECPWLSESGFHPRAKLIVTMHMFCSGFPKRETHLMPVYIQSILSNHTSGRFGFGDGGGEGAGEHDFPFHVTVNLQYILE